MTFTYLLFSILVFTTGSGDQQRNLPDNPAEKVVITEVLIKSILSKDNEKVLIDISLPDASSVGFEMYDAHGKIEHLWNARVLHAGHHQLALTLPFLDLKKYWLHIIVGEVVYKHIVLIP